MKKLQNLHILVKKNHFFLLFKALFVYIVKSNIEISISNSNVHKNCLNEPQNDQKCENVLYGGKNIEYPCIACSPI